MHLSIITINYNNKNGLIKTVGSVLNQTFKAYEYIIVDGGSTDGSSEWLQAQPEASFLWSSEPDLGVYDAMNKGWKKAKGTICLFLNSGDTLHSPDSLALVMAAVTTDANTIFYGDVLFDNGKKCWKPHFYCFRSLN